MIISDNGMLGMAMAFARVMEQTDAMELKLIEDAYKGKCPKGCPNTQKVGDVSWGDPSMSIVPETHGQGAQKVQTGKLRCSFAITASIEITCSRG